MAKQVTAQMIEQAKGAKLYTLSNGFEGEQIGLDRAVAALARCKKATANKAEITLQFDANRWITVAR